MNNIISDVIGKKDAGFVNCPEVYLCDQVTVSGPSLSRSRAPMTKTFRVGDEVCLDGDTWTCVPDPYTVEALRTTACLPGEYQTVLVLVSNKAYGFSEWLGWQEVRPVGVPRTR